MTESRRGNEPGRYVGSAADHQSPVNGCNVATQLAAHAGAAAERFEFRGVSMMVVPGIFTRCCVPGLPFSSIVGSRRVQREPSDHVFGRMAAWLIMQVGMPRSSMTSSQSAVRYADFRVKSMVFEYQAAAYLQKKNAGGQ